MNKTSGNSKEVGIPRYLSLVVPLRKFSDELVQKELGDKNGKGFPLLLLSSEVEPDSVDPGCQEYHIGRLDAQTSLRLSLNSQIDPLSQKLTHLGSGEDGDEYFVINGNVHKITALECSKE
ncbi:hypothetical protein Tco_1548279 [Tanacetum coccineum]